MVDYVLSFEYDYEKIKTNEASYVDDILDFTERLKSFFEEKGFTLLGSRLFSCGSDLNIPILVLQEIKNIPALNYIKLQKLYRVTDVIDLERLLK